MRRTPTSPARKDDPVPARPPPVIGPKTDSQPVIMGRKTSAGQIAGPLPPVGGSWFTSRRAGLDPTLGAAAVRVTANRKRVTS